MPRLNPAQSKKVKRFVEDRPYLREILIAGGKVREQHKKDFTRLGFDAIIIQEIAGPMPRTVKRMERAEMFAEAAGIGYAVSARWHGWNISVKTEPGNQETWLNGYLINRMWL